MMVPLAMMACQGLIGAVVLASIGLGRAGVRGFGEQVKEAWAALGGLPPILLAGFYGLQVAKRYTEGQTGTEILLLLSIAPALVLLLGFPRLGRERWLMLAASAVAILGTVAILANWERPSSLSPFALFPFEESLIVAAALCWALLIVLLARRARELDVFAAGAVLLAGGSLLLAVIVLATGGVGAFALSLASLRLVVMLGLFGAALGVYSWLRLLRLSPTPAHSVAAVYAAPVLLSLLILFDQQQGLSGPNPMIERPVILGSLLIVLALAVTAATRKESAGAGAVPGSCWTPLRLLLLAASALGLLSAFAALILPVQANSIEGVPSSGPPFAAAWSTLGYQGVGAWLVLVAAALAVLMVFDSAARRGDLRQFLAAAGLALACALTAPQVADSVFVAWQSWIPTEVQQGIGTPYTTLLQNPVVNPALIASAVAVGLTLLGLIVKFLWKQQEAG